MTYHPKSEFIATMMERGFLADCTDYQGLDDAFSKGVVPAYIGYDATAQSLHVGHLMNIMVLRWLQKCGHKPITLMGGGTTKVGDPSFRSEERPLLDEAGIDANIASMKQVFANYLEYDDGESRELSSETDQAHVDFRSELEARLKRKFPGRPTSELEDQLRDYDPSRLARMYLREVHGEWPKNKLESHPDFYAVRRVACQVHHKANVTDKNRAKMLNNAEWLDDLNYLSFLRDIGRHFSVNRMLSFESVKSRLDREQSLSFLEFNYMILQAYDFLELNRRYDCLLQMGGSDQWGNIVNGIDLTRRVLDHEIYGMTTPLLTTSDGRKMGKSQGGAVWLNGDILSPYEFWQFWRNTTDADTGKFLKIFTELPVEECNRLGSLSGSEINEAKIILANEVTTLLHGAEAARTAEATAREVFEKGGAGGDLPTLTLASADVADGISIVQLIVKAGLAGSGKEAKRLIAENGAKLNDEPLTNAGLMIDAEALASPIKLSAGKKRHAMVEIG